MAQPNYMGGLLGAQQTPFNPTLPQGLLARMAMPGQPAAGMAENMMAMGQPQAPAAPAPAPVAPVSPVPPPAAPTTSPTQLGLMSGGMAAMEASGPGGSLGQALGAGLAAGTASFVAAKNEKADLEARRAKQEAFASQVMALPLPPEAKTGLINMGAEAGAKLLAENGMAVNLEAVKQGAPVKLGEGDSLVDPTTGKTVAQNIKPKVPFDIAKLTPDMREAFTLLLGRDPTDADNFGKPLTVAEAKLVKGYIDSQNAGRAPRTSVSVNLPGPKAGNEQVWKGAMDLATAEFDRVKGIPARLKVYDDIISMTGNEKYLNGGLAETRLAATKIARMLGLPVGNLDKINSTDVILSKLKNAALQRLPELDSRPTDTDMEILIQAIGSTEMSPAALARIMRDSKQAAIAEMGNWNRRRALQNQQFIGKGYDELPAYLEELPIPGAAPKTNNLFRFDGVDLPPRGGK